MDASVIAPTRLFVVPLGGAMVLLACTVIRQLWLHRRHEGLRWQDVSWTLLPLGTLAFLAAWIRSGLVSAHPSTIAKTTCALLACGLIPLLGIPVLTAVRRLLAEGATDARKAAPSGADADLRQPANRPAADSPSKLCDKPSSGSRGTRARALLLVAGSGILHVLLLVAVSFLGMVALETPINPSFLNLVPTNFIALELSVILLACILLYFLGQRHGTLVTVIPIVLGIFGLAQFFIMRFKNTVIAPMDLMALGTAAAVAGGYSYEISSSCLRCITYINLAWALCSCLRPIAPRLIETPPRRVATNLLATAVAGTALFGLLSTDFTKFDLFFLAFDPKTSYLSEGSLNIFVLEAQRMGAREPEGYSASEAQELLARYAAEYDAGRGATAERVEAETQFQRERPSVVVVMDETFADLSIYENLHAGYAGPQFFKTGMPDSLVTGQLSVSVFGGGTCNTEFEFLTGMPLAYVGSTSSYPYTMYDLTGVSALPQQLSSLGYSTTAIHPNLATNWNRDVVYEEMGFDSFFDIDDFQGAPTFHNGVTDRATFDKVLTILREEDEPQFVFDVTMQNHSGYDVGNIPADRLTDYHPSDIDDSATNAQLNEYLSCIQASDEDLAYLVDELSKIDRPVVLIYFGDHQPDLGQTYNTLIFGDHDSLEHAQRPFQTVYTVWANYDVAGDGQVAADSPNAPSSLAATTLDLIGAPLTDYQKAQVVIRKEMPAVNAFGLLGTNGAWYALDDASSPVTALSRDYSFMAYYTFEARGSTK